VSENPSDLADVAGEQARADTLDQIGTEILARKDELGALLARTEGKTLPEAVGEAARDGNIFKFFAGEALRTGGEHLPSVRSGVDVEVIRGPLGVVGIIAPWNFPLAIPARKIAPALTFGNAVVFKPAELVSGCGWALVEIISHSGLPAGVFNLVMGSGRQFGQTLVDSPLVDGLSFTGSAATGEQVLRDTAARRAKVQLEMGGKNPLVVLADADLDHAVECAMQGAFFSTGQRCTASSRLIVEAPVHDAFVARLKLRMKALKFGHALGRGIFIGPAAGLAQLEQNLSYVEIGKAEGAERVLGRDLLERDTAGRYMSPALFLAKPQHRVAREEIFGPVACVPRAEGEEHALAVANDTPYGLCRHLHHVAEERHAVQALRAGGHGDGQPAHRGRGLPRALRRPQGLQPWAARAGTLRGRVLHDGQNGLCAGVKHGRP
jgi:aldehyde dehydrogenase (NAD+)